MSTTQAMQMVFFVSGAGLAVSIFAVVLNIRTNMKIRAMRRERRVPRVHVYGPVTRHPENIGQP